MCTTASVEHNFSVLEALLALILYCKTRVNPGKVNTVLITGQGFALFFHVNARVIPVHTSCFHDQQVFWP